MRADGDGMRDAGIDSGDVLLVDRSLHRRTDTWWSQCWTARWSVAACGAKTAS